jgi:hypothetical protein
MNWRLHFRGVYEIPFIQKRTSLFSNNDDKETLWKFSTAQSSTNWAAVLFNLIYQLEITWENDA